YDPRPARQLQNARKPSKDHRLPALHFATLRLHAAYVAKARSGSAKLISFHKRCHRSRWQIGDVVFTLYGGHRGGPLFIYGQTGLKMRALPSLDINWEMAA
ncbi:MAG: hypothetical protein JW910_03835, partial [Anaerolineae bacterium]|nr:hypothetical protein [Anaerolineae bacterium]